MTAAELDIEGEDGHRTLTHDGTGDTHTAPHSAQLVRDAISVVGQQSLVTSHQSLGAGGTTLHLAFLSRPHTWQHCEPRSQAEASTSSSLHVWAGGWCGLGRGSSLTAALPSAALRAAVPARLAQPGQSQEVNTLPNIFLHTLKLFAIIFFRKQYFLSLTAPRLSMGGLTPLLFMLGLNFEFYRHISWKILTF